MANYLVSGSFALVSAFVGMFLPMASTGADSKADASLIWIGLWIPYYRSDSIGTQKLALYQRAPDRLWLLAAQDQRRCYRTVPGDCIHDCFQFLRGRHEDLENETILSGQSQHLHHVRH